MTIDKLSGINPLQNSGRTNRTEMKPKIDGSDCVQISSDAKNLGEIYKAVDLVKAAPDVRQDRIEEVKLKMQNPDYLNSRVLDAVAEKLTGLFGL